ncbi:Trafficking protein particle complex subunit 2-like protein [Chytridiales sp. JEL 0842]|nr:Trafficking protein particle complex subunit 2-like protein [Chytridiales sp. JEL 0842]
MSSLQQSAMNMSSTSISGFGGAGSGVQQQLPQNPSFQPPTSFNVQCVAVIGKQNNPLYLKTFSTLHKDLKFHYCCHTACDIIEERVSAGSRHTDQYLGLLYAMEDLAVFGFMTNTRVKFIVVIGVVDTAIKDLEMKNLFKRIHSAYVGLVSNPFWDPESNAKISSRGFNQSICESVGKAPVALVM